MRMHDEKPASEFVRHHHLVQPSSAPPDGRTIVGAVCRVRPPSPKHLLATASFMSRGQGARLDCASRPGMWGIRVRLIWIMGSAHGGARSVASE
jgi:hypothetical protein